MSKDDNNDGIKRKVVLSIKVFEDGNEYFYDMSEDEWKMVNEADQNFIGVNCFITKKLIFDICSRIKDNIAFQEEKLELLEKKLNKVEKMLNEIKKK